VILALPYYRVIYAIFENYGAFVLLLALFSASCVSVVFISGCSYDTTHNDTAASAAPFRIQENREINWKQEATPNPCKTAAEYLLRLTN